jgi:hypothetical protein
MRVKSLMIPPAIATPQVASDAIDIRNVLAISAQDFLVILPCGIRPVKDPLYTVATFECIAQSRKCMLL